MAERDVGPVAWRDSLGRLERMNGPAWATVLREEKAYFTEQLGLPVVKLRIPAYKRALVTAQDDYPWFQLGGIQIWPWHHGSIKYRVKGTSTRRAQDIDIGPDGCILAIEDVGGGSHFNQLTCRHRDGRHRWSIQNVGEQVAAAGERVYFLRPEKKLWYKYLCSVAADGSDFRVDYEETDHQYSLSFVKTRDHGLFAISDNNGYSKLFCLGADGAWQRIDEDAIYHIPCGYSGPTNPVRIVLTQAGYFEVRGDQVILPSSADPFYYDPDTRLLLTRSAGSVAGYIGRRRLFNYPAAKVQPDIWAIWSGGARSHVPLLVSTPTHAPMLLKVGGNGIVRRFNRPGTVQIGVAWHEGRATATDGTSVPYGYAVMTGKKPKALLVVMYGAYGLPTAPGSVRAQWAPLLEAGWAIGYAYVRGGGDNGWAWAEAGRRTGRIRSIEDAEACVAALRSRLQIPAAKTAIYGRSAGGVLIGALANRNPKGDLFGIVYGEVPYVDVLQTATNPVLPLTEMEYDEFGDPAHKIEDLAFWVRYSPVTNIPAEGIPALKVLCRTGLNDTQVYAYEPVKWIRALRGKTDSLSRRGSGKAAADTAHFSPKPKILGIASGQGHFYSEEEALQARAEDTALLDSWI